MPPPGINFELAAQTGNLLFLSGAGPQNPDGSFVTGKLGQDFTVEKGYEAARLTAINQLGVLKATLGDLGRVNRIVKLLGMVNAVPDFTQHPAVINGASDLLVEVFGDCGRHARSAVGMASLPFGIPVEIEMIVEAAIPPDVGQNSDASGYLLGDTIHPTTADHLAIAGAADIAVVPVPATLPLFATGLIALALAKRRCRRTRAA
jgi:enamine deaminase RidA (YjgF/YER057c/UK114 family)